MILGREPGNSNQRFETLLDIQAQVTGSVITNLRTLQITQRDCILTPLYCALK